MRPDEQYTALEAKLLDLMFVLHAEHGGGNNSTFTTHVVSSSGTDTYSVMAASLGSLKGPRHGGANIKVVRMFEDMKANLRSTSDADVRDYLARLLDKQAFDKSGLIYGMGHAVYSLSDPRADIMRRTSSGSVKKNTATRITNCTPRSSGSRPKSLPKSGRSTKAWRPTWTSIPASSIRCSAFPSNCSRPSLPPRALSAGSAHRIEELANRGKIIRPNYMSVSSPAAYVPLKDRA